MAPLKIEIRQCFRRSRHGGSVGVVDFWIGGIWVGWLHPFESDRQSAVMAYARGGGSATTGKGGTIWRLPDADAACSRLWGTEARDEIARALGEKEHVLLQPRPPGYVLPAENVWRFARSRYRDRTWSKAIFLREIQPEAVGFLVANLGEPAEVGGHDVRPLLLPAPKPRVRQEWACEQCGLKGHREAFRERTVPGLAGSVGLDCPSCPRREADSSIGALMRGNPRGRVARLESNVLLPMG